MYCGCLKGHFQEIHPRLKYMIRPTQSNPLIFQPLYLSQGWLIILYNSHMFSLYPGIPGLVEGVRWCEKYMVFSMI